MADLTGRITWWDLTVPDATEVRDFYAGVVGWTWKPHPMGEYEDFEMQAPGAAETVAGVCHARGPNADVPPVWLPYVQVEDVDACAVRATEHGGRIVAGPRPMGTGRFCVIEDPAGAKLALFSPPVAPARFHRPHAPPPFPSPGRRRYHRDSDPETGQAGCDPGGAGGMACAGRVGEGSEHVEDRRSIQHPVAFGGIGLLLMALVVMLLGGNPFQFLADTGPAVAGNYKPATAEEDQSAKMVSVVLKETEGVWDKLFRENGLIYRKPTLVLFSGQTRSACGFASAAVGPFYCPPDEDVYVDLSFFTTLSRKFGAPGDFAQAYVIAHEVGHHVQKLLGISDMYQRGMMQAMRRQGKAAANQWTTRMELQADFFAGVWAHHAHLDTALLEPGDLEEALNAANQIGDDALQMKSRGYVVPDSFTHGTAKQRAAWFRYGVQTGDMMKGNTFDDEVFFRVTPQ